MEGDTSLINGRSWEGNNSFIIFKFLVQWTEIDIFNFIIYHLYLIFIGVSLKMKRVINNFFLISVTLLFSALNIHADEMQKAAVSLLNVHYVIPNTSPWVVKIFRWYTPIEGIRSDCFEVIFNNQKIPYDGPMIKRGTPS